MARSDLSKPSLSNEEIVELKINFVRGRPAHQPDEAISEEFARHFGEKGLSLSPDVVCRLRRRTAGTAMAPAT